jgi:hypothetical protein
MMCKCGFVFAGPGEFRNCEAFVTSQGRSVVVCPECKRMYVDGWEVKEVDGGLVVVDE